MPRADGSELRAGKEKIKIKKNEKKKLRSNYHLNDYWLLLIKVNLTF